MSFTADDLDAWLAHGAEPPEGWDFSTIEATGRVASSPLPWSYGSVALSNLHNARSALDIGTGGGELLSRLAPFPPRMCATEAFAPNVPVALARLTPLGVAVADTSALEGRLPYENESFDVILSRHSAYAPDEVARTLRSGGRFVTQQVGSHNQALLNALLGAPLPDGDHQLAGAAQALAAAGLRVRTAQEAFPTNRYYDVGAVVYYLRAIPWQIPDFSLARYADALRRLGGYIAAQGYLDVSEHRFFIIAEQP